VTKFRENPTEIPAVKAFIEARNEAERPALYATLKRDFSGRGSDGVVKILLNGQRVRVNFITGFGDYGVTTAVDDPKHHEARAVLAEMTDYSNRP
jgi:hypothetical protein